MLCVVFGLSLLDRANISAAYIGGMGEDLELAIGNCIPLLYLCFPAGGSRIPNFRYRGSLQYCPARLLPYVPDFRATIQLHH
jgi:hypothetical protein